MTKRIGKRSVFYLYLVVGTVTTLLLGIVSAAEKDFPRKEITLIVNIGPGGGRDIISRGVAKTMSKYTGVPIVVLNEGGAGGARGLLRLYTSPPDGYTLGVGTATAIIDQIIEKRDYDNKKFSYIGRAQSTPSYYFVKPDAPFRSLADFKSHGKVVRHSAFSLTSNPTVAAMVFANRMGFPMVVVGGYKSSADAVLALIRGEVEFTAAVQSSAMPFVKAGQMRPIASLFAKRSAEFPDVPTLTELGFPDLESLTTDYWFMAPPQTPKPRMQFLEDAFMKTLKDPEFLAWAKGAGVDPAPLSGEEMSKMVVKLFDLLERYKEDILKYMKK